MSAVLDKQELSELAEASVIRIRTDPVWFMTTNFNIKFDIWQVEALEAMADVIRHNYNVKAKKIIFPLLRNQINPLTGKPKQKFTIRSMHGPGKTFFMAAVIIWFHFSYKSLSPATAPTIKQLKNRLWPNIRKIQGMGSPFWRKAFEVRTTDCVWYNDPDWKCAAETGATPENLQGYHPIETALFVGVDEASGVDEEMFPVIASALSVGEILILLLIGNPTKIQGTFADSHLKPKVSQYYYQIHVDLAKTSRVSRQWVTEMVDKYGADSPVVRVRCYGEFAAEDENQLISLEWLEAARNRTYTPDGSIPRQRLSVDCSDGGGNFTVITHALRYASFTLFKKQTKHSYPAGRAVTLTRKEVARIWYANNMKKENGDDIVVDSLGVGAGVTSELVEEGLPVIRYTGGSSSDDKDEWRNRRVQSFMVLRDDYRNGKIVYADGYVNEDEWDDHDAQLCSIRSKLGTEKVEDLLTKKEMVDKGIMSPDRADSEAMQMATQSPILLTGSPIIVMGGTMETASEDCSIL